MARLMWLLVVIATIIAKCHAESYTNQCNNTLCNRVDYLLRSSLDLKIDPCYDFRTYSCGSHEGSSRNIAGGLIMRLDRIYFNAIWNDARIFNDILDNGYVTEPTKTLEIEKKIYESCKMYGLRDEKAKQNYYYELPHRAKNLDHLHLQTEATEHWISSDLMFANRGFGFAFFDFKIVDTYDPVRSTGRYIQISPPKDNILEITRLFDKKYGTQGGSGQPTSEAARKLKNFLNELNRITNQHASVTDKRNLNISELYRISFWNQTWNEKARGSVSFDWEKIFKSPFIYQGISDVPPSYVEIIVKGEDYFNNLIDLLCDNSVSTIENYINLRFISKTIGLVDPKYIEYSLIPQINHLLCSPGLFLGTAHDYASKHFPRDNQNKLKEIFEEVRKIIIKHLGTNGSDDFTKAFVQKLSNADVVYGYPDWLLNKELVANFYPDKIAVNQHYFINEELIYGSVLKHNLKAYGNHTLPIVDINQFFKSFTSHKIQIFEDNTNEIVLPVRVFSEANMPFFSTQLFDAMNYGSVATIIATEIYQKWLDGVADSKISTCIRISHLPQNLTHTQMDQFKRRATAYVLGLRAAYEAWPNKSSNPIVFKNLGAVQNSQLFFLSFTKTLCILDHDNEMDFVWDKQIVHPEFINTVLANVKEFQDTFRCEEKHHEQNP